MDVTNRVRFGVNVERGVAYACGVVGMALALGLAVQGGAAQLSATEMTVAASALGTTDRSSPGSRSGSRRVAPAVPEASVQSFLIIEPFEVRHEVMLRLGPLASMLGLDPDGIVELPAQAALLERSIALVLHGAAVQVDGLEVEGVPRRVDFMTVDSTGALPRSSPIPEPVRQAVIGVVMAYPADGMPQRVSVNWNTFPSSDALIPVALIDPESTVSAMLTVAEPTLIWENNLTEDPIPTVAAVNVEPLRVPLPLLSLALLAGAVVLLIVARKRRRLEAAVALTRVILVVALMVAPFQQLALALPASAAGAPSEAQARRILAGLLPNVYRAMEFRDEGLIFDRLAVSVTGETLTEVYLEQRRTLEMEERGGAQARVEAVEILSASEIEREGTGFRLRATWTAAGMVTHFGHRHFRQNRYDARLTIVPVQQTWKIRSVEILEQYRLK